MKLFVQKYAFDNLYHFLRVRMGWLGQHLYNRQIYPPLSKLRILVSEAVISGKDICNCTRQYYVGCNNLSMPEIAASGTKVPEAEISGRDK